jgi:hypothetical protein
LICEAGVEQESKGLCQVVSHLAVVVHVELLKERLIEESARNVVGVQVGSVAIPD